jgi:uncharacterized protein (TIGR03437 family)
MKQAPLLVRAPFRHSPWAVFSLLVLLALATNALGAANPSIVLQVSSETAPPGGYAQFKVSLTSPALIGSGAISMDFDPAVFGNVANVAIFSATGDALGYANVSAQHVAAYFSSATAAIGQLPDLPVFVVSIPVLPGAAAGTTSAVTVDPSGAPWNNASGKPYSVSVNAGMVTIGGSLSVQSVTPGGGVLPAGTVLHIEGTGFDQSTTVAIDDVIVSSTQLIGPQQINVTLGAQTEMTGKQVHLINSSGTEVDYFPSLPSAPGATPAGFMGLSGIQPLVSLVPYTTAILQDNRIEHPNVSDGLALLNPNLTPVTVILELVSMEGPLAVEFDQSLTIPASTLSFFDVTQLFPGQFDQLWIMASAPVRILEYVYVDEPPPSTSIIYAAAPTAATTPLPPIQVVVSGGPVNWSWQVGTPLPSAANLSVGGNFSFTVSVSGSAAPFLAVTPQQGTAPSTLTVAPNFASVTPGTYAATITLTPTLPAALSSLTVQPTSIAVTLMVSTGSLISLAAGSNCCVFDEPVLNNPATGPDSVTLMSNGTPAAFTVTIGACAGGNWLSATPASGTTPATLTFTANPVGLNLPGGFYNCPITIQGPSNTLTLAAGLMTFGESAPTPPVVQVTPVSLTFQFSAGTSPAPQTLTVTSGGNPVTVSVQTQSGGNWLNAVVTPGTTSSVVTVSISPGLAAGNYSGIITISSPGLASATVLVGVTVVGLPPNQVPLNVTPSPLLLTAPAGLSASAQLNIATPGGIPVAYTASASTSAGGNWLAATLPSGLAPAMQLVQAYASQLAPGVYNGSINIVWGNGSLTVPVIFTVTASLGSPPATAAIVNAASEAPVSIAPGEIITLFGTGLGAAVNGLTLDASGKVATSLGGTQVLINGVAAPLIYASPSQLNVIVPYEVTGSTIANIVANIVVQWGGLPSAAWGIPVAPSSPAIFTIPENGAGQAAVLNQDNSVNSSSNAAARGTVIQLFATGGGQTSPASSTGSVAQTEANLALPVTVTIGGVNAQVLYAGNAPEEVEGVVQINAFVPQSVIPGATLPLLVTIGGVPSQIGVTVAIQ